MIRNDASAAVLASFHTPAHARCTVARSKNKITIFLDAPSPVHTRVPTILLRLQHLLEQQSEREQGRGAISNFPTCLLHVPPHQSLHQHRHDHNEPTYPHDRVAPASYNPTTPFILDLIVTAL